MEVLILIDIEIVDESRIFGTKCLFYKNLMTYVIVYVSDMN